MEKLINEHKKEVKKLNDLESELVELILDTEDKKLQDIFIQWQEQREKCNKMYVDIISSI